MIEVKHLHKTYGKVNALHDVNLIFPKGEITGVAGRNGAGKTTLFKCIAGLENYMGEIILSNDFSRISTGLLDADPYFLSKITGKEYLRLMTNAVGGEYMNIDLKNVFDLPLDQYAESYSTGMKKKLAFTGLLLQDNDIVILDEPFNGVDIQSNVLITEIIKRMRGKDKIVILSSHILGSLSELCDRIHIIDDGHVVKSVDRGDYGLLNQEMIDSDFQHKLERLGL